MDQRIIDLYDEYTHRPLDRRVFMERLVALAGSTTAAQLALASLVPSYAQAAVVSATDPRVSAQRRTPRRPIFCTLAQTIDIDMLELWLCMRNE